MVEKTHDAQPADREADVDARCSACSSRSTRSSSPLAELVRELGGPPAEIEDAVRRLVAGGLVHRHGEFLFPTRAAIYHDALFEQRG